MKERTMPNHYTTRFIVTGEPNELTAFALKHIVKATSDNNNSDVENFDFNTVITMPAKIKNTTSGSASEGGLIALGRDDLCRIQPSEMLQWAWVKEAGITTVEGIRKYLAEKYPDGVEEAKRQIENHKEYGSLNWHDWSIWNWGTKWNSYWFESNPFLANSSTRLEFTFQTPWNAPMFIIKKLIEMYPNLKFTIYGRDEFDDDEDVVFNDESSEAFWKCIAEMEPVQHCADKLGKAA